MALHVSWLLPSIRRWPWQRRYNYNRVMASLWIRCLQLLPHLEREGVHSTLHRLHPKARVAILMRDFTPPQYKEAQKLKRLGIKLVLDTPVNYFSKQDLPAYKGTVREDFLALADLADVITCPTAYIAQAGQAAGYRMVQLEDAIDPAHFTLRAALPAGSPVLSWSGVSIKAGPLERVRQAMETYGASLDIIADLKPNLSVPFTYERWRFETFPKAIHRARLGVFPRDVDDEYNLGHSFFKIGVYLACGVPVICTPLPSYAQIATPANSIMVEDASPQAWEEAIGTALASPQRFSFDSNPVQEYSPARLARRLAALLASLVDETL